MNRIDDYRGFSGWDPEVESYLEDADCAGTGEKGAPENTCCAGSMTKNEPDTAVFPGSGICKFDFDNVPQLTKLLRERLGVVLSDEEIKGAVRRTFRHKPRPGDEIAERDDREVVDFIYQM